MSAFIVALNERLFDGGYRVHNYGPFPTEQEAETWIARKRIAGRIVPHGTNWDVYPKLAVVRALEAP